MLLWANDFRAVFWVAAIVADTTPSQLRGTAFGLFNLASGVARLIASVVAGVLGDWLGQKPPFMPERYSPSSRLRC